MNSDTAAAFFEFIFNRQLVWYRRNVLQQPAPWSDDKILQTFKFCNVYRELDAGTQAIRLYITKPDYSAEQKIFNIIAYRFFNRRDTIENLFGGMLDPQHFDFKKLEKCFDEKKREGNIFSNAYLITAHAVCDYRPHDKHIQILQMLDNLRPQLTAIRQKLQTSSPQQGLKIIEENVPLAGPFLAGQILLDITYAGDIVNYSSNDFLIVGPGAHWGLNIIWERKLSKKEADEACRFLHHKQPQAFENLKKATGKDWRTICWNNPSYPNFPYLSLHDVQNSLCEFRKYWRLKNNESAKKRYYK